MSTLSATTSLEPGEVLARPRFWRVSTITLALFAGAVLLPQGVGIPSPGGLPNFDLPRLCAVGVIAVWIVRSLASGRILLGGAPRTLGLLAFIGIWQIVAAFFSDSPAASTMWAIGNAMTMWVFAIAAISLVGGEGYRTRVARTLTIVAIALSAWSVVELVTQQKLVPVRNLWSSEELGQRFSTTLRRVIPGSTITLPYMSIGPFAQNLTLAGALCGLGGFLLMPKAERRRAAKSRVALFLMAILSTQSRVGIAATGVMLLVNSKGTARYRERWRLLLVTGAVVAVALFLGGDRIWLAVRTAFEDAGNAESRGSFSARFASLRFLAANFGQWWLVGFGPGSLFDADRVVTAVQTPSDPGSYFAFFLESGVLAGVALTIIMLTSIRAGFRSTAVESRAVAVSLVGFWITTLSSITPWSWGMALAMAGFVEGWTRAELTEVTRVD